MSLKSIFGYLFVTCLVFNQCLNIALAEGVKPGDSGVLEATKKLRELYDQDLKQMLAPMDSPEFENAVSGYDLLAKEGMISKKLLDHLKKIGGIDFDLFLSAQDWDPSWKVSIGEPKKLDNHFEVAVTLDRLTSTSIAQWRFIQEDGKWVVGDVEYTEPGEKPFTLSSLEGMEE